MLVGKRRPDDRAFMITHLLDIDDNLDIKVKISMFEFTNRHVAYKGKGANYYEQHGPRRRGP